MQTRDQVKNWKVVVSAASVAALGLTGLAVASPGGSENAPPAINIQDQREDSAQLNTTTTTHSFEVVPGPVTQFDSFDSIDSSDDTLLASASVDDSVDSADDSIASIDSPDSPDDSIDSVDSPDDSIDSVDSPDDSVDSPDESDSLDSLDSSD
jgi:hypothetical protein